MTMEQAQLVLRREARYMLVFWTVSCWMWEPQKQPDPKLLLQDLLSPTPSRLTISTLHHAFATLCLLHQSEQPT